MKIAGKGIKDKSFAQGRMITSVMALLLVAGLTGQVQAAPGNGSAVAASVVTPTTAISTPLPTPEITPVATTAENAEIVAPVKEVVTSQISGIEIMDLEDAVKLLWKNGIYAESGMGCTGPIILVNEAKTNDALKILAANDFIAKEQIDC